MISPSENLSSIFQRKELRYVIAGSLSELIEYSSFLLLQFCTHLLVLSNSVSFLLGIASGFIFHKLWTFAGTHRLKTHHQVNLYIALAGFNFLVTNILISFFVHSENIRPFIAKLLVMGITALFSYFVFNRVIFRPSA